MDVLRDLFGDFKSKMLHKNFGSKKLDLDFALVNLWVSLSVVSSNDPQH